jgi:hypothetical protein
MSEVYNGILKGVRVLPLTALITETLSCTLLYFADRVLVANALVDMNKPWCEKMQRYLDEKAEKSRIHGCSLVDALRNKWLINIRVLIKRVLINRVLINHILINCVLINSNFLFIISVHGSPN